MKHNPQAYLNNDECNNSKSEMCMFEPLGYIVSKFIIHWSSLYFCKYLATFNLFSDTHRQVPFKTTFITAKMFWKFTIVRLNKISDLYYIYQLRASQVCPIYISSQFALRSSTEPPWIFADLFDNVLVMVSDLLKQLLMKVLDLFRYTLRYNFIGISTFAWVW